MIFSLQDLYSDAQAITASAASTNYYDRGAKGTPYGAYSALVGDMGKGSIVPLRIQVVTTFATLTSLKVAVQADTDPGFATALETIFETEAIAAATLVAGYYFNLTQIPMKTTKRYIRLYYTVAGSDATAGKITAGHVLAHQTA